MMDILSLLTDPKVWIIFAIIALLVVLGIYTWRQSNHIEVLKHQHTKMSEQVKHGLMLSEDGLQTKALVHLRPDMASTMSEETCEGIVPEEEEEWDEGKSDDGDGDGELSDDEHNAYIQQLIRIQDGKRAKLDEFINPVQQQSGHGGAVYDSNDEEIIFHDYNDESDYASDTEIMKHVEKELSKSATLKESSAVPTMSASPSPSPSVQVQVQVQDKIIQDMQRMDKELKSVSELGEDDGKEAHAPLKLKFKLKEKPSKPVVSAEQVPKLKIKINPKVKV
jgi:hypothetical protein